MAYSIDYRIRAIEYYHEGHTQKEVREAFKICPSTIRDWETRIEAGSIKPNYPKTRKKRKLPSDEELIKYVDEHNDDFLYEIGEHYGCSDEAVRKALKKLGYTYKKSPKLHRTR